MKAQKKMKNALICTEQVFIGHKIGPSPRKAYAYAGGVAHAILPTSIPP